MMRGETSQLEDVLFKVAQEKVQKFPISRPAGDSADPELLEPAVDDGLSSTRPWSIGAGLGSSQQLHGDT